VAEMKDTRLPLNVPLKILKLWRNQWLKPLELEKLQNKKLRAIVKHSYENVPLYHNLFRDANLKPDDIKTTKDLSKLPILTKKVLTNLPLEQLVAKTSI
jgi:phenylacetate-CoA ligase